MEDSILTLAPKALKLKVPIQQLLANKGTKKMMLPLFSGLGAGIASFFAMKKKKIKTENGVPEEQLFI